MSFKKLNKLNKTSTILNDKSPELKFDISSIKLIVGLGNPGKEFVKTRHNAGFMFFNPFNLDFLTENKFKAEVSNLVINNKKIVAAKPLTYMNASGESVVAIINFYKIYPEQILIVHDDLDIKLGDYKIQFNKGPKVHNGILSIEDYLNSSKFWRLRVGIDNRTEELRKLMRGSDYVLGRFSPEEIETLDKMFTQIKESFLTQPIVEPV